VHDDNVYYKYYETFYILFHTGMRISEFCGLTLADIDMRNRIIDINHQLQRSSQGEYVIEKTKNNAGIRKLPMTDDVYQMFQAIIEDRPTDLPEIMVQGYAGFLFRDKNGMPLVAMHWSKRFRHMVGRYNDIYRVQMPNITPQVCRHTYCSNQAKAGMNLKTLQCFMGHSDISVTMNVYIHIGFDDAEEELKRMEEFRKAQAEVEKKNEKPMSQKMFKVV
jgi:integrase